MCCLFHAKKDNKNKSKQAVDIQLAVKEVEAINTEIMLLEVDFIQGVVEVLGPNRADGPPPFNGTNCSERGYFS